MKVSMRNDSVYRILKVLFELKGRALYRRNIFRINCTLESLWLSLMTCTPLFEMWLSNKI